MKTTTPPSTEKRLATLEKQVARLTAQLAKARQPGKLRATKLVVDALEVVDASGKVVASIDKNGNLFCRTLWASSGRNVRGVFIDGVTFRSVSAGMVELIGMKGNTPAVQIEGWTSAGKLLLQDTNTRQRLLLQGDGAPLMAHSKTGAIAATLSVNSPAGGNLKLTGTEARSKAHAQLRVSHLSYAGELSLADGAGRESVVLPPRIKKKTKKQGKAKRG